MNISDDRIEVTINVNDYPDGWKSSPAMWECWLAGKLKEAGIPIDGTLVIRGIKRGALHRLDDPKDFGSCKYVWIP